MSVLLDGEESEMIFIDHPSTEMSVSYIMIRYSASLVGFDSGQNGWVFPHFINKNLSVVA